MAVEYPQALNAYLSLIPGAQVSTPEGQEAFNAWWGSINELPPETFAAAMEVLSRPDQREAFSRDYGGDMKAWLTSVQDWWSANGHTVADKIDQYGPETKLLDTLGFTVNPEALPTLGAGGSEPLEKALFEKILQDYIGPDLAGDPGRQAEAAKIVAELNRSLDGALKVNDEVLNGTFDANDYLQRYPDVAAWAQQSVASGGHPDLASAAKAHYDQFGKAEGREAKIVTRLDQEYAMADDAAARLRASSAEAATARIAALDQRKVEMTAALDRMSADRSGALDAQTAQLREGLAVLETERRAALQELTAARINAAEGQVTGINQGLEFERDRITAQQAKQGFIGGSAQQDAAMTRATVGARQGAAEVMGNAKVANATDSRNLGDAIAGTRFNITGNDATTRYGIADETARGRFSLDDSTSAARVGVENQRASEAQSAADTGTKMRVGYFDNDFGRRLQAALLPATLASQRISLIDLPGQVGQSGLNRSLNTLNWFGTSAAPPLSNPSSTTASQVGSDIAALGAGLTKSAFNVGNQIGWGNLFKSGTPAAAGVDDNGN
jgi:hypothetical protein